MRYRGLKIVLFSAITMSLSACSMTAWHRQGDYRQQAQTVPPIKTPQGTKIQALQDYYPVPGIKVSMYEKKPSIIPPGSYLDRFNSKLKINTASVATNTQVAAAANTQDKITGSKWAQNKEGDSVLILAENQTKVWNRLGKALQATPYQVLDEDRSSASYYVLDTKSTGNRITEKTPIYRLFVAEAQSKNGSQVEVLDKQNKPANSAIAKRILGTVQKQLL